MRVNRITSRALHLQPARRNKSQHDDHNAFISRTPESQVKEALSAADRSSASPLVVKTLAVKDNISTLDFPTTCASATLSTFRSAYEATAVRRMRAAGALVVGKTNLDEFGMGSHSTHSHFGAVANASAAIRSATAAADSSPARRSAGGSSGGSAAGVAAGAAEAALGSDTGGSVRLPAAYNGVVGLKPSYGRISRWGLVAYAHSLDTVGVVARDVARVRAVLRQAGGFDADDPSCPSRACRARLQRRGWPAGRGEGGGGAGAGARGRGGRGPSSMLRIGVPVEYNIEELEPAVRAAWRQTLARLQQRGHELVPVSLPATRHALSAYYVIAAAEAASNLSRYDGVRYGVRGGDDGDGDDGVLYSRTRGRGLGPEVRRRVLLGSYTLSAGAIDNYFLQAQRVRRLVQRDFDAVFAAPNPLARHRGDAADHNDGGSGGDGGGGEDQRQQQFDLSDMHESVPLRDKLGPAEVDVVVCPTAPTLPPTLERVARQQEAGNVTDAYVNDVFTVPASLAGLPAVSVPARVPREFVAEEEGNVDVAGMQVIAQYWDDELVLDVAEIIEGFGA